MERAPKFHLVDQAGKPLDERFCAVVRQLEQEFFHRFRQLRDPAVIANCVEQTALRVHVHEGKRGRVENLRPFFLRVFSNVVRSLLRGPHHSKYEAIVSDRVLEARGGFARTGSAEQAESWIIAREALERLDERKREMLILDALGYSAKEIARTFGMSESNVYTTLHRAREEAKKVLNAHRSGSFNKP
jgi:RNA polymerase sigma factor (sigma-70 family)